MLLADNNLYNIVCITYVKVTGQILANGPLLQPSPGHHMFTLPPGKNWTDFDRAGEFTTIECSSQAMFLVQQFRVSALSAQLCARHPSWNVCELAKQRGRYITLATESDAYRKRKSFKQPGQFKTS